MNQNDRKEFDLIHSKIDTIQKDIESLKNEMSVAHNRTDESLRFIKENMFNPHEGLWAETKQNSLFRESSQKWRYGIGIAAFGLWIKEVWRMIQN